MYVYLPKINIMKVLLTSPTYPPYNSGLGNAVQIQAKCISSLGIEVHVATSGDSVEPRWDNDANAIVHEFQISGTGKIGDPINGDKKGYQRFLKNSRYDVVILNAWQNWSTDCAIDIIDALQSRIYVYSHGLSVNTIYKTKIFKSLIRCLLWRPYWWSLPNKIKKLDGVIFLSHDGCDSRFDDLRLVDLCKKKKFVIGNAVSKSAEEKIRKPVLPFESRTQIISVGSYDWFKGHDFSIRAYANSTFKNKVVIKIFGQKINKYTYRLKEIAAQSGIHGSSIKFHEGISGEELLAEYQKSCCLINGSHSECQPLVLLDSMAVGLPFISRISGAIPNLRGGICVSSEQAAAIKMNEVLSDPGAWLKIIKAGQNHVQKHHTQEVMQKSFQKILRG